MIGFEKVKDRDERARFNDAFVFRGAIASSYIL